jgi:hypothetical protein
MKRLPTLSLLLALLSLPGTPSLAGLGPRKETVTHELLPDRILQPAACARVTVGRVRALLVGIDSYGNLQANLAGAVADAKLLASALQRRGAEVEVAANVNRDAFVQKLTALATNSRCGDTALVYFGGHSHSFTPTELQFLASDATNFYALASMDEAVKQYPLLPLEKSPGQRLRRMWPGTVDSTELLDYFDRLRDNGINVVFIADSMDAAKFAGRMPNDFQTWQGHPTDAQTASVFRMSKAAYFGIYAGQVAVELPLPPGDKAATTHGLLSWAIASAISLPGTESFANFSRDIVTTIARASGAQVDPPVFESSHPDRSPFATGLPAGGVGESGLRGTDSRRIDITTPALQRGLSRVGLGNLLIKGRVVSPTPPVAIAANQEVGKVNSNGTFEITLPVSKGENRIILTAWWNDSDFVPKILTVLSREGDSVVQGGRQYAVLIGNQNYKDAEFPSLSTPIADAHALAQLLERRYGFSTQVQIADQQISLILDNAERVPMLHLLAQLHSVLMEEDSLLLYYGGHGIYENETNHAYWLPVDANSDERTNWISDGDISDAIAHLNARHILIIADSCYSGALQLRGKNDLDKSSMTRTQFLDQMTLRQSRNLLTSGANEPVADNGGHGHSVFAQALLDGLADESKPFTAGELFERHIHSAVGGSSKQVPQYSPMKDRHEGGEFVFIPQ